MTDSADSDSRICPTCGAAVPAEAPENSCPKCLLDPDQSPAGIHDTGAVTVPHDRPEPEPEFIGPYRLLSPLGEGGMGQVFVAQQKKPIRRKVALKIIKPGMDSKEILTRFEAERQAVALMDHTNIARVYDAGTTDDGRPYFVMELVEGKPLTEFCDQKKLSLEARLDLFRQVCHAVQHAHQKGIIHRDLKPSNILVTTDPDKDDRPVPKIIDFGVAKALGSSLTDNTMYTLAGQVIGTPQYMSPEQASLDANDVDTRADIYSLGILLYELLTGRTPLEMAELRKAGLDAVLRTIREEEATRPSTRLSTLEDQTRTDIAESRQLPPSKLTQSLRGDLDWIVMKALEKERSRRYETANAFAADIGRYLTDEPVSASPPSQAYKFRKFARRNKGLLTAAAAVVVVLVAGIATTAWQAKQARIEQQRAEAARADAEKLVAFMLEDLREKLRDVGKLDLMEGVETAVREYYESTPGEQSNLVVDERRARSLLATAETFEKQGRYDDAQANVDQAVQILQSLSEREPADLRRRERLGTSLHAQAKLLSQRGRLEQARQAMDLASKAFDGLPLDELSIESLLALSRTHQLLSRDEIARDGNRDQAQSNAVLALRVALMGSKRHPELEGVAETLAESVSLTEAVDADTSDLWKAFDNPGSFMDLVQSMIAEKPDDYDTKATILELMTKQENLNYRFRRAKYEYGSQLARELTEHDPTNLYWQRLAAKLDATIGGQLQGSGLSAESLEHYKAAEERYRRILDIGGGSFDVELALGDLISMIGLELSVLQRRQEALAYQKQAVEIFESLCRMDPENASLISDLSFAKLRLSGVMGGSDEQRLQMLEEAFQLAESAYQKAPNYGFISEALYYTASTLAGRHLAQGELELASKYNEAALTVAGKLVTRADVLFRRGQIAAASGNHDNAATAFRDSVVTWRETIGKVLPLGRHGGRAEKMARAVRAFLDNSRPLSREADELVTECLPIIHFDLFQMDPKNRKVISSLRTVCDLRFFLFGQALESGDEKTGRSHLKLAVDLSMHWSEKAFRIGDRLALLKHLASDFAKLDGIARQKGLSSIVSAELVDTILDSWNAFDREALSASDAEAFATAHRLPFLASVGRARLALAEGDGGQAAEWLAKAAQFLRLGWETADEGGHAPVILVDAMRDLAKMHADQLEDVDAAQRAWTEAIAWREQVCETLPAEQLAEARRRLAEDQRHLADLVRKHGRDEAALTWLESAAAICRELLEGSDGWHSKLSSQFASTAETLGQLYEKVERWEDAERIYRETLATWQLPEAVHWGDIPGELVATRLKVRLAQLYGKTQRWNDPQRQQWFQEAYDTLHPLAEDATLPQMLKWVYESARNNAASEPKEATDD